MRKNINQYTTDLNDEKRAKTTSYAWKVIMEVKHLSKTYEQREEKPHHEKYSRKNQRQKDVNQVQRLE